VALIYKERRFKPYTNDGDILACEEFSDVVHYGGVEHALDRLHCIIGECQS